MLCVPLKALTNQCQGKAALWRTLANKEHHPRQVSVAECN